MESGMQGIEAISEETPRSWRQVSLAGNQPFLAVEPQLVRGCVGGMLPCRVPGRMRLALESPSLSWLGIPTGHRDPCVTGRGTLEETDLGESANKTWGWSPLLVRDPSPLCLKWPTFPQVMLVSQVMLLVLALQPSQFDLFWEMRGMEASGAWDREECTWESQSR